MEDVKFNILTRTSRRPIGFQNCYESVRAQGYSNFRHIVSFDNDDSFKYLQNKTLKTIRVFAKSNESTCSKLSKFPAPYNLYCNSLLDCVDDGWIIFLDDDDHLIFNGVFDIIKKYIQQFGEDYLLIFRMRYPNGKIIPENEFFKQKRIVENHIGSPCFAFHSKYKNAVKWDGCRAADFRFINRLSQIIPHQFWIDKVLVQINNYGDLGGQNDMLVNTNMKKKLIRNRLVWELLPKKHFEIYGIKVFDLSRYKNLFNRALKKVKGLIN